MNRIILLLLASLCVSPFLISCATTGQETGEAPSGISAAQTGYTRESVYDWQDRTMRQIGYR